MDPSSEYVDLAAEVFAILSDPTRIRIVLALRRSECRVLRYGIRTPPTRYPTKAAAIASSTADATLTPESYVRWTAHIRRVQAFPWSS